MRCDGQRHSFGRAELYDVDGHALRQSDGAYFAGNGPSSVHGDVRFLEPGERGTFRSSGFDAVALGIIVGRTHFIRQSDDNQLQRETGACRVGIQRFDRVLRTGWDAPESARDRRRRFLGRPILGRFQRAGKRATL